jgi:hypothetical protein
MALLAAGLMTGCRSEADRVTGKWQGTLNLSSAAPDKVKPGTTLRVVCHIEKNSDGTLGGSLDSPDQNAADIPIDTVTIKNGAFHLKLDRIRASYDGQLSADGSTISGQWKQGGYSLPCDLKRNP